MIERSQVIIRQFKSSTHKTIYDVYINATLKSDVDLCLFSEIYARGFDHKRVIFRFLDRDGNGAEEQFDTIRDARSWIEQTDRIA